MKKNNLYIAIYIIALLIMPLSSFARENEVELSTEDSIEIHSETHKGNTSAQASSTSKVKVTATSTEKTKHNSHSTTTVVTSSTTNSTTTEHTDKDISSRHRSSVSNFVQSLVHVANREGKIGEQVRVIAHEQNDAATTTLNAINKIETRGNLKTFLLGTDYKNIGILRSESVKTENRILKLKALSEQATSTESKVELNAQIKALGEEQVKIQQYIIANEEKFSLLGWLSKMLVTN